MTRQKLASLGLALLVVGSLTGVGVATSLSPTAQSASDATEGVEPPTDLRQSTLPNAVQQPTPPNLSEVSVTAIEAINLAENRTDGKAVVVGLTSQNDRPTYNVTVLHENRSLTQVEVDATEPRVTDVRRNFTVVASEFLGGEAFDYAELRPLSEAIRLVQNRSEGVAVNAGLRRGELTYGVALRTPDGQRTTAVVSATDQPLLGIRTSNATGPGPGSSTTTA